MGWGEFNGDVMNLGGFGCIGVDLFVIDGLKITN